MLLSQKFTTYDGAAKRARFERAFTPGWRYIVVRFRDGVRDTGVLDTSVWNDGVYHWQIEKQRSK